MSYCLICILYLLSIMFIKSHIDNKDINFFVSIAAPPATQIRLYLKMAQGCCG